MEVRPHDVDRLVEDLKLIRAAIARSGSIIRWLPLSRAMRMVYLLTGLVVTVLCGTLYLVAVVYGDVLSAPVWVRTSILGSAVVAFVSLAVYKVLSILAGARRVSSEYTLLRLIKEVYSRQTVLVIVPFLVVAAGVVIFLVGRGLSPYLVASLALLLGLLLNALVAIFSVKELAVGGDWFVATGLLGLFLGERLEPLLGLILTFGLGFIAMYVAGTLMQAGEGQGGEDSLE